MTMRAIFQKERATGHHLGAGRRHGVIRVRGRLAGNQCRRGRNQHDETANPSHRRSSQRCIDDHGQRAVDVGEIHIRHAQITTQFSGIDFHRPRFRGLSGLRLRECRGPGRVKHHPALHFFHRLMNVAVEHGDRAEPLQKSQRLGRVVRPPTPLRIDRNHSGMCAKTTMGVSLVRSFKSASSHANCSAPRAPKPFC